MAATVMSAAMARAMALLAILAGLTVVFGGVMLPLIWQPAARGITWISAADVTPGAWGAGRVVDRRVASPVRLPDPWRTSGRTGAWTYHIVLPDKAGADAPGDPSSTATQGLWIPRASTVVAIWLDDQLIAGMGHAHTVADKPWLLSLPHTPGREQPSHVHIVVAGHGDRASGLSSIAYGSLSALEPHHEAREALLMGGGLSVFTTTLIMSMGSGWVAYHLRSRAVGLFMCITLLMSLREALVFWGAGWFPAQAGESMVYASAGAAFLVSGFLLLRYIDRRAPLWEMSSKVLLLVVLPAVAASFLDVTGGREAMWLWYCMSHVVGLWPTVIVTTEVLKSPSAKRTLILWSTVGVSACTLLDDWHAFISSAPSSYEFLRLAPVASVSALLSVVVTTYIRVSGALVAEERFKVDLQVEVHRQRLELERLHAAMQEKTKTEAAFRERSRIARDLHDGLGSQLVHILSDVEADDVGKADLVAELKDLLDQLRLTMDALDPVAKDVIDLLAQIRYRLRDRWHRAGITLTWAVTPLASDRRFTPEDLASLQRMLYEIFTNIVKHANATHVTVRTFSDAAHDVCGIAISDDGIGFSPAAEHAGRGMHNIASRARDMGLSMQVESGHGRGARLTLSWPLRQL